MFRCLDTPKKLNIETIKRACVCGEWGEAEEETIAFPPELLLFDFGHETVGLV